jgi:two-component system chemotaxis response regulator CheY
MPDATPRPARIALVGHCGPDSYALRSAMGSAVPGSEVVFASDEEALAAELARADLLLVNRTLDGEFRAGSGLELIRLLRTTYPQARVRIMLVSNYPDAQAEAEAAGALPGFGKREMYAAGTRARVRAALGLPADATG